MTFEDYAALDEAERMKLAASQLAAVASVQSRVLIDEPDEDLLTLEVGASDDDALSKELALMVKKFRRLSQNLEQKKPKDAPAFLSRFGKTQPKPAIKLTRIRLKFGNARLKPTTGSTKTRA